VVGVSETSDIDPLDGVVQPRAGGRTRSGEYALGRNQVPVDVLQAREREPTHSTDTTPGPARATPAPTRARHLTEDAEDDATRIKRTARSSLLDLGDLSALRIGGRYRLEGRLGRGGMAEVFRGRHVDLDRPVAIKMLHPRERSSEEALRRFMQEARLCARIRHPNVIEVFDFGSTSDGLLYLVMELLAGEDLRATIARHRGLPWPRVRSLMMQICAGLEAAHVHGVVHRDLKPSNCYRVPEARRGEQIKLLDFGVATVGVGVGVTGTGAQAQPERDRGADTVYRGERITVSGVIVGTPEYMSPEQARGGAVDHRSDVYAAGIILCELLTGKVPFTGKPVSAVLDAQIHARPPTLGALHGAEVDPRVEAVFAQALAKQPQQRFHSIRALSEAVEAIEAGGRPEVSGVFEIPRAAADLRETLRELDGRGSQGQWPPAARL